MSTRVVFATANQGHQDDLRRLLADIEVVLSRVGPPVPPGLGLVATAQWRARAAFAALGERCFVENTELELEGARPWRGHEVKAELATLGEAGFCARYGGRAASSRVVVALCEGPSATTPGAATPARPAGDQPTPPASRDELDGVEELDGLRLFTGALEGEIATAPRGPAGRGWDRLFVPDGYHRTLAELGASTYLVNMRHQPYLDLADHLRGRRYGGAFEAHVTVRCAAAQAAGFAAWCDQLGIKHLSIELATGAEPTQPMTASVHRGELREVQAEVHALARALLAAGYEVVRTKIEALPRNRDIPDSDVEAAAEPARYFEYHLKLVLPPGGDLEPVRATADAHGARLSRNARRVRSDGSQERYLTLRLPGLGRRNADARFAALEAAIATLPVTITRRVREYTVYDSNLALDRGWR